MRTTGVLLGFNRSDARKKLSGHLQAYQNFTLKMAGMLPPTSRLHVDECWSLIEHSEDSIPLQLTGVV
jgi:hypothetical protein